MKITNLSTYVSYVSDADSRITVQKIAALFKPKISFNCGSFFLVRILSVELFAVRVLSRPDFVLIPLERKEWLNPKRRKIKIQSKTGRRSIVINF